MNTAQRAESIVAPRSLADLQPIRTDELQALERVARDVALKPGESMDSFTVAMTIADRIFQLRQAITPAMGQRIMALQGIAMGFLTDRDKYKDRNRRWVKGAGYPWETVRDCVCEALLRGIYPWWNMFNILGERVYITKAGFDFLVRHLEGFEDLRKDPKPPVIEGSVALVTYSGSFCYDGQRDGLERTYALSYRETDKVEQIWGRAERKWLRDVYEMLTRTEFSLPDGELGYDHDLIDVGANRTLPLAEALPADEANAAPAAPVALPFRRSDRATPQSQASPSPKPVPRSEPAKSDPPKPAPAAAKPNQRSSCRPWWEDDGAPPPGWGADDPLPEPDGPEAETAAGEPPGASSDYLDQGQLDALRDLARAKGLSDEAYTDVLSRARSHHKVDTVYDLPREAYTEIMRVIQSDSSARRRRHVRE